MILAKLLAKLPARSPIQFSDHVTGQGPAFFALACKRHLEGTISKRAAAPYRSGRAGDWVKVKCTSRQEFVIGGYRHEVGGRPNLGSLLLGYFNRGRLTYVGQRRDRVERQARPLDHGGAPVHRPRELALHRRAAGRCQGCEMGRAAARL